MSLHGDCRVVGGMMDAASSRLLVHTARWRLRWSSYLLACWRYRIAEGTSGIRFIGCFALGLAAFGSLQSLSDLIGKTHFNAIMPEGSRSCASPHSTVPEDGALP